MKRKNVFLVFLIVLLVILSVFQVFVPKVKAQESNVFGNPDLPSWKNITVVEDSDFVVVDNADGFVFKFRKGTSGYNEIWQNNSQIVANEQWVLEYLAQAQWKQRGIPQYVTWEQPQPYHVLVKRFYDDFLGTTFNITYSFYGGFRPKISFEGDIAQEDNYRIVWKVSGINKTYVSENVTKSHVKFWNEGEEAVVFDYSDVYESFGNITTVEIKPWANDHKLNEIFNVGFLDVGLFRLDPNFGYETIGSSHFLTSTDRIIGSIFTIGEDGVADSITVALKAASFPFSGNAKCGIYLHSDLSLVGSTEQVNVDYTLVHQWFLFNFVAPKPNLTVDMAYLLVVFLDYTSDNMQVAYDAGDTDQCHYNSVAYNGFPDPFVAYHLDRKISIFCSYTAEEGEEKNFWGAINPQFTINHEKTVSFTRNPSLSQQFTINKQKTVAFNLFSTINPTFSVSSLFTSTAILNLFASITQTFTITIKKAFSFNLYPHVNPTFTITSITQFTSVSILNFWGAIIQQFTITMQKTFTWNLYSHINPTWTITSIFETPGILNIHAIINMILGIESTSLSSITYGIDDAIALAAIAFVLAIVGICLIVSKTRND